MPDVQTQMVRGSAWMLAMRWAFRGIGMVSTVILARLLTPADFGVVAMAQVIVGFLQIFSYINVDLALIREPAPSRSHYDTAWTFQALMGLVLCFAISVCAPLGAEFLREPRLAGAIRVLAIGALIGGLSNIGTVDFRRNLDFAREFRFLILVKAATFVITVSLAFWWRSYWALIAGSVAGELAKLVLSYAMHPYRPRPSLAQAATFWSFSRGMVLFHLANFLVLKFDELVVAKVGGTSRVGNYHVASELSTVTTNEVVMPLSRALFPGYAKLGAEPGKLGQSFRMALSAIAAVITPVGVGLAVVAEDAVAFVLGAQWSKAVPLIQWLAIGGIGNGLTHTAGIFLVATKGPMANASIRWFQLLLLLPLLPWLGIHWGAYGVAVGRSAVAAAIVPVALYIVVRTGLVNGTGIAAAVWRPLVASGLMALAVRGFHGRLAGPSGLTLAADVAVGAVVFLLTSYVLWQLSGRPGGPEASAAALISRRLSPTAGERS